MEDGFTAQVIATFGRHLLVRDAQGREFEARPFGRHLGIVCGDRTLCRRSGGNEETHALQVLPRTSTLYRANLRGASELIVANLDLLLIVAAPMPRPDFFMLDRYLAAAASAHLAVVLVLNKCELADAQSADTAGDGGLLAAELDNYASLGNSVVRTSVRQQRGLQALRDALGGHAGAFVGQSGVGKSSLIRVLASNATAIVTATLDRDDEGRHTTTASRLYDCEGGGQLMDSPGVRDFAPSIDHLEPSTLGFTDVAALAPQCRFQDCRHMIEPHCAVQAAAAAGALWPRRYESYRRLRRLFEQLHAARGPGATRPGGRRKGPR